MDEIQKQIERINVQIESERRIAESWKRFVDCDIKTAVIHQAIGVIRGLETAKEALEYIMKQQEKEQLSLDEYSTGAGQLW